MRWPFGPPHLTLKPSKKETKNKKRNEKKKNKKKKPKKERKRKKHKNTKKELFSYQSKFSFFLGGCPKVACFDNLAQKTRTQKHYKNRGFSLFFFGKGLCVTKRPFLDQKPKFRNSNYHFLCLFSLSKTKNTKICWNPNFYSVLANLKKRIFQNLT